jgi:putative phage-type endonuclease
MYYLPDLPEVSAEIVPREEEDLFHQESHAVDFIETALHLMDIYIKENPTAISDPDFEETFKESIEEILLIQFEDQIYMDELTEEDIANLIEDALEIFLTTIYDGRGKQPSDDEMKTTLSAFKTDELEMKINYLRSLPQPVQRTAEWYAFRHGLITASNAYKAFEGASTVNQLIYEKCHPLKPLSSGSTTEDKVVNVNSPLHWGQKYEPLSVLVYEDLYGTIVEDFGCIQHPKYTFLGASPDGINVSKDSPLYGRMLEIKNVVNREITGIPKKEYWIQTQLQMEVCDLDECDFLETKFVEYENSTEFEEDDDGTKTNRTKKNELKGMILYFSTPEGKPFYVYKDIRLINQEDVEKWEISTIEESEALNRSWIKTIYWKLETLSCVLIQRNHQWFSDNIQQIQNVWSIIERERVTGYEHRAPKKRPIKDNHAPRKSHDSLFGQGCLITLLNHEDC